jgi:hypothetical protein
LRTRARTERRRSPRVVAHVAVACAALACAGLGPACAAPARPERTTSDDPDDDDDDRDAGPRGDGGLADAGGLEGDAGSSEPDAGGDPCQDGFEPNDTFADRVPAPLGPASPLDLCAAGALLDEDWFQVAVPTDTLVDFGLELVSDDVLDLDLTAHDDTGACVAAREPDGCAGGSRLYETRSERFGLLAPTAVKVAGFAGAVGAYGLEPRAFDWHDGPDCGAFFDAATCEGRPDDEPDLLPFPLPRLGAAADAHDGYVLAVPSNYRFARRESIMLVRHALAAVDDDRPVALADMSQRDGLDPGSDVGAPRHPESTHSQGAVVDLAYYNTLVDEPTHALRVICDADGGSTNALGSGCMDGAPHVVDVPRQALFIATLFASPRVRVIGVDGVVVEDLRAEADTLLAAETITQAQRDAFDTQLASGDAWPFHHHHVHVAMHWWVP